MGAMSGKEEREQLKQSGLNAAWFKRYEHVCSKYAANHNVAKAANASISPMIERDLVAKKRLRNERKTRRTKSCILPPIHGESSDGAQRSVSQEGEAASQAASQSGSWTEPPL